jgi:hypothetical protein
MPKKKRTGDGVDAGAGIPCRRCGGPSTKYVHSEGWQPQAHQVMCLTHWYVCQSKDCRTRQFNPLPEEEPSAWVRSDQWGVRQAAELIAPQIVSSAEFEQLRSALQQLGHQVERDDLIAEVREAILQKYASR